MEKTEENQGTLTPEQVEAQKRQEEPFKQLKGEFNRKIDETKDLVTQLSQQIQALVTPKPAPAKSENYSELMFSDTNKFVEKLKNEVRQETLAEVGTQTTQQTALQNTIATLASEYPELADNNSDLTKGAVEILKGASALQKTDPAFYELAVLKAAQQKGIQPKSKRPQPDEELMGASYGSPQGRSKRNRTDDAIIKEGKATADAFGLDLSTPEKTKRYVEHMKKKGLA